MRVRQPDALSEIRPDESDEPIWRIVEVVVRFALVLCLLGCGRLGFGGGGSSGDGGGRMIDAVASDPYSTAVLADGPIAYWRFDETSGTVAHDEVGGLDGTYTGGCTLGAAGALTSPDTAFGLDGATCYVEVGDQLSLGGAPAFTIELWASATTIDQSVRWLVNFDLGSSTNTGYTLALHQAMMGLMFEEDNAGSAVVYASATTPSASSFHHIVVTATSSRQRLYVDGSLATEQTQSGTPPITAGTLVFGHIAKYLDSGTNFFHGTMDELAYYDKELTAAQVAAHYAAR